MGLIIIGTIVTSYVVGRYFIEEPLIVALIILVLAIILLTIAFLITQSFERLAEANRMKSDFVSVASHQLQAPLTNLIWAIEILMSGQLGIIEDKQVEYFKILKENTHRMKDLIANLLTVSRIEQKPFPLKKKKISLVELIKDLISEFKPFAKASNVTIEFTYQENLPEVLADPLQIKLVISNLLDNAIRYIKEKGNIIIKLERKGKNLYFEIVDNGVGIPKEDQKYIFQKFFRAENILRYQTQGTGLGLFIAKSIIEKSGGKIGFESEENKGTTFWFTLPIC